MSTQIETLNPVLLMALRTSIRNTEHIQGTLQEAISKGHFPRRHTLEYGWGWRDKLAYAVFRHNSQRPYHLVNREYETLTDGPLPNGKKIPIRQYTEYGLFLQIPPEIGVQSDYSGVWLYNYDHRPWDSRKWAKDYLERWVYLMDFLQDALTKEEAKERVVELEFIFDDDWALQHPEWEE